MRNRRNSSAAFALRLRAGAAGVSVESAVMSQASKADAASLARTARSGQIVEEGPALLRLFNRGVRRLGLLVLGLVRLRALVAYVALGAARQGRQPGFEQRRPRLGHARGAKPVRRFLDVVAADVVALSGEAGLIAHEAGRVGTVLGVLFERVQRAR